MSALRGGRPRHDGIGLASVTTRCDARGHVCAARSYGYYFCIETGTAGFDTGKRTRYMCPELHIPMPNAVG